MEFSKNYGQIIIGYGLLSIGITLLMLFMQTAGIFWLILAGATIVGGIWIIKKERNDRKKYDSDIRMSGIKIGTVSSQELDNITFQARVLMSIDSDIRIPDDSSAKITTDGLLGGNYISIEPGGNDIYLESGDEILFTQGSVDLIGLVGEALFSVEDNQ